MVGLGVLQKIEVGMIDMIHIKRKALGLLKLLHVSSQIPEQSDYEVTAETRQHLAVCLARLWEDMVFDTKRTIFREKVDIFFK